MRPRISRSMLRADAVAGITTAVMLVPQAMAYALLAGLDPIIGLYAATLPLVVYAVFGTSRRLAIGPAAMDSMMVGAALLSFADGNRAVAAAALAGMVGVVQLLLGAFRAGDWVRFLSRPVIVGFTAAAGLIIGASQLGSAVGLTLPRSQQVHVILWALAQASASIHLPTLAVTGLSCVALVALKRWRKRWPRHLLVVMVAVAVVWGLGVERVTVSLVGDVPAGLPPLAVPFLSTDALLSLVPSALALALVGVLEALSIGKHYDPDLDANKELVALGLSNLGSAAVSGFPVTGGFSRTAVHVEAGAQSSLALVVTAGAVTATLLFLTAPFAYLPKAVLAAIILTAVTSLIDVAAARTLWRTARKDFAVAAVAFGATLGFGILPGLALGVTAGVIRARL